MREWNPYIAVLVLWKCAEINEYAVTQAFLTEYSYFLVKDKILFCKALYQISRKNISYRGIIRSRVNHFQINKKHNTDKEVFTLESGDCILTPTDIPVGMRTNTKAIYIEITIRRNTMNNAIKVGEVFKLAELLPYQEGKIINMDVAHNEKMKFVIMSFDDSTGLAEHAAPGEALILALDGEGVIGYEGEAHPIKAGENFKFAAGGRHWVKANGRFKMALLITLE